MATIADPGSPLYGPCQAMRSAAGELLSGAQRAGAVRDDLTAAELFALATAIAWIAEQAPELEDRRERLLQLITEGLSTDERAELVRLRRENRVQAMEIEILKRATRS